MCWARCAEMPRLAKVSPGITGSPRRLPYPIHLSKTRCSRLTRQFVPCATLSMPKPAAAITPPSSVRRWRFATARVDAPGRTRRSTGWPDDVGIGGEQRLQFGGIANIPAHEVHFLQIVWFVNQ